MTSKLVLYNNAIREIGNSRLTALSEVREDRYLLDDIFDSQVALCLEEGQWNFATRAIEIAAEEVAEPSFGYDYAFAVPSDWVRTVGLSAEPTFNCPLLDYKPEQSYWWASVDPLYVRYVSNHAEYGLNYTIWPASFARYVELALALRICPRTTESEAKFERIEVMLRKARANVASIDAMNQPTQFPPAGSWVRSRGGGTDWRDRGPFRA